VVLGSTTYITIYNRSLSEQYQFESEEYATKRASLMISTPEDITLKATNEHIHLIIYVDTDCEFCRRYEEDLDKILEVYGDVVSITYRNFDLPIYPHSRIELLALECVGTMTDARAYRRAQKALLNKEYNGENYETEVMKLMTTILPEISETKLQTCIQATSTSQQLRKKEAGGQLLGVNYTPTTFFVVDGSERLSLAGNIQVVNLEKIFKQLVPDYPWNKL